MPPIIRQTDNADQLPPYNGSDSAPYERAYAPRIWQWQTEAVRWAGIILLLLVCYWLFSRDLRTWAWSEEFGQIKAIVIVIILLFVAKRLVLVRQPGGYLVSVFHVVKADAQRIMIERLDVERTHAATPGRLLAQQTFSPTYQVRNDHAELIDEGQIVDGEIDTLPPPRPDQSMIEVLKERGHIDRSGHSLLLGYGADMKPSYIEMSETGLAFVAGHSGSGKSSTVSLLLAQAAMMGWEIVLCDKHGRKSQGLVNRTKAIHPAFSRIAIETGDIIEAIDYWHEAVTNRLAQQQTSDFRRILLVIDEFVGLMLDPTNPIPPATLHKLLSVAVEGRGVQAHGILIAHQCSERMLGKWGANLRRAVTTRIVHRADSEDAAFLLGSAFAKQALTLQTGKALFYSSGTAPMEVQVPYVVERDLEWTAQHMPQIGLQPTMPRYAEAPSPLVGIPAPATVATVATDTVARDEMIRTLRRLKGPNGKPLFSQDAIRDEIRKAGWTLEQDRLVALCQEVDRGA